MPLFFRQLLKDISWKHLIISTLMAIFIAVILGAIFAEIREAAGLGISGSNSTATGPAAGQNSFTGYFLLIPLQIFFIFINQLLPCLFLTRKTPDRELTNGLALGMSCSFFIYRYSMIFSLLAIIFSIAIAWQVKKRQSPTAGPSVH